MKMKTNKYLTMAAAALMMAACSSEDVPQVDSVTNTPIRIHAMVAELKSRAGIASDTDFSQFYLSVENSSDPTKYSYSNVQVTNTGSGWEPALPMYWQNSTTQVTVTAATFPLTEAQDLAVQTNQSTEANVIASDHLYMAATLQSYAEVKNGEEVTKATGAINVNFSHIMSKVNLTITLADEFDAATENPISNVTFQGTVASSKYDAGTWADIDGVTATDIKAYAVGYTKPTAQYEVILVPQQVAANGFAVQFQIGGRQFKWTSDDAVTLESGQQYTLALTAGDEKVSGASFSSTAWGNGGNNNVATE